MNVILVTTQKLILTFCKLLIKKIIILNVISVTIPTYVLTIRDLCHFWHGPVSLHYTSTKANLSTSMPDILVYLIMIKLKVSSDHLKIIRLFEMWVNPERTKVSDKVYTWQEVKHKESWNGKNYFSKKKNTQSSEKWSLKKRITLQQQIWLWLKDDKIMC